VGGRDRRLGHSGGEPHKQPPAPESSPGGRWKGRSSVEYGGRLAAPPVCEPRVRRGCSGNSVPEAPDLPAAEAAQRALGISGASVGGGCPFGGFSSAGSKFEFSTGPIRRVHRIVAAGHFPLHPSPHTPPQVAQTCLSRTCPTQVWGRCPTAKPNGTRRPGSPRPAAGRGSGFPPRALPPPAARPSGT